MRLKITLDSIVGYGLLVLVFLLPVFWLPFSFESWEFPKLYLLFFGCLALVFLKFFSHQKSGTRPFDLLVLFFLLVSLLSGLFSVDKISSIVGFYGRFSNGLVALFGLVMVYFFVSRQPLAANRKLLTVLLVSGLAVMLVAFLAMAGILKGLSLPSNFNLAAPSLEGLAMFLAPLLFLALGRKGIFSRVFIVLALIMLVLVDYSLAWIVLALTSLLFLLSEMIRGRADTRRLIIIICLAMAILGLAVNFQQYLPKVFTGFAKEATLDAPTSWQISINALKAKPILGSGVGTFFYDFSRFRPTTMNQSDFWQIRFDRPASQIAEILATTGIVGLLSYLALIVFAIAYSIMNVKRGEEMLFPLLAMVISQLVYYQSLALGFCFWLFLGVIASLNEQKSEVGWLSTPKIFNNLKTVFLKVWASSLAKRIVFVGSNLIAAIALLAFIFWGIRIYIADVFYSQALSKDTGEQELQLLNKATSSNPYFAEYQIMFSKSLLDMAAQDMAVQDLKIATISKDQQKAFQEMSQAATTAQKAVQLSPNWVASWENLGVIYQGLSGVATGADQAAINAFKKAIDLEPTNPLLYLQLGRVYFARHELALAEEQFKKAASLKLDFLEPQIFLGLVKEQQGDLGMAIQKLASLENRFPLNIEVAFQLGRLYFNQGKNQEAISQFSRVLLLNPGHLDALYSMALAYEKIGKITESISYLKQALEISPDNQTLKDKLAELEKR